MNDVYQRLAEHLDNLPGGFPETDSGLELKILKRLFSPEEAEIALSLSMKPEPVPDIAERLNMDEPAMAQSLENMSKKGLIFSMNKHDEDLYMAAQFVVGIWEYHVNDLDEELIKDVNEYLPHLFKHRWMKQKTKQLRVIPISKSISAEMRVMAYEEADKIIQEQSKIVVAPCICRKEHNMMGKGCDKPSEACLIFGSGAYYYEKNGMGRSISKEQALEILNNGAEAGLVLQPGNSKKPSNICLCCGCCCQVLKNLKVLDQPAQAVCSNFYANVNEELCVACGVCEDRCQMDAVTVDDTAQIDPNKCIGCGVCVVSCDVEAIYLVEKSQADRSVPPSNTFRTYLKIAKERGLL